MLATLRRFRRQVVPVLAAAAFLVLSTAPLPAAEPAASATSSPRYAIHIDHAATADLLRRVLDGAREALGEPRCQQVLEEFSDLEGRSLRARLDELGHSPESYLGLIIFYDGRRHPRCEQKNILAVTHVGSRVVHVCPRQLDARARRNPRWTEATLIHEALHTLGLGENPPSSQEITQAVMRQCE
jgi:hypothetical protein